MIRYFRPVCLLLPLVFFVLPLAAQRDDASGPTMVSVYIMLDNNRPLQEQLRVELSNESGIPITQGYTDVSGRAKFQVTGVGGYILKVSGTSIQDGASESFEVYRCPPLERCTQQVIVRVKAKDEVTDSAKTQSVGTSSKTAVTSAAELRVPENARKAFDQGLAAWQKADYPLAAEKFEKAVADYPQYDSAYNNLGVMYAHLGQNDKAMAAFKRSVELNDKNADADRNLARLLIRQKDYPPAEDLLKKSLAVQPTDVATLTMLAIAEIQDAKPEDALRDAQKVHTLPHDGFAVVHFVAGEALEEKHQAEEAKVEYTTYLRESPNGPEAAQVKDALHRLANSSARAAPKSQ